MKVIDIIEATQMRSVSDLTSGKPKAIDTHVPTAVAGGAAAIGAGAKADAITKRAGRLNRRFKGEAVLKTAIARVLPSVVKRQSGKAIPYLGLVVGLYFGAKSAMQGDALGAALEVGSSLPWVGILAATPAIALIVAREAYNTVYEDPANPSRFLALEDDLRDDYDGTIARLKELGGWVTDAIDSNLEDAKAELDAMERKRAVMKDVQAWNDEQRKSVSKPDDIKWGGAAVGNVPLARQAFNQRKRTGQEYK